LTISVKPTKSDEAVNQPRCGDAVAAQPAAATKAIRPMDETRSASEGVRLAASCRWKFASPDKKFAVSSAAAVGLVPSD
jgi:hypothetical protein